MGDVGERAAVHEGGRAFERLHQIGRERVLQQHGHGARRLELGRRDRLLAMSLRDDHAREPLLQLLEAPRQAEDRHHLRGDGDVETGFARHSVGDAPETRHDLAQRAIIHVEDAPPGDAARVDVEIVAPIDVVVDKRGEKVVRRRDGVEIAGEMQVDLLHRNDLGIAAARGAPLHAEAGSERRLAQRDHGALADLAKPVAEAYGRRRLALAGRGRVDRGHEDELALVALGGLCASLGDELETDLADVASIGLERAFGYAGALGYRADGLELGGAGDLDV